MRCMLETIGWKRFGFRESIIGGLNQRAPTAMRNEWETANPLATTRTRECQDRWLVEPGTDGCSHLHNAKMRNAALLRHQCLAFDRKRDVAIPIPDGKCRFPSRSRLEPMARRLQFPVEHHLLNGR